ncbi:MAG: HAD family phosphatase [Azospirillaceae bacterium]|nr:HAD family phosphatase [Azospirillaceae bacterium]
MPFPHAIHAVIFDMDGLLIDSERPLRGAMLAAAVTVERPLTEAFYSTLIGRPYPAVRQMLVDHFGGEALFERFTTLYRGAIQAHFEAGIALMTGVVELLDDLDAAGIPMAVATSTQRERALHHLTQAGIAHRFRAIIGGDDVTQGKPHPEPYLKAAAALDIDPSHCLALEDSHNGIRAAHAAGMMAVMVPDLLSPTAEIEALCRVAADLHEVRRWVAA